MTEIVVCREGDLPPGERRIVPFKRRSIGVFNVDGEYFAVLNHCPHHRAEICRGRLGGRMVDSAPHTYSFSEEGGRILACPDRLLAGEGTSRDFFSLPIYRLFDLGSAGKC